MKKLHKSCLQLIAASALVLCLFTGCDEPAAPIPVAKVSNVETKDVEIPKNVSSNENVVAVTQQDEELVKSTITSNYLWGTALGSIFSMGSGTESGGGVTPNARSASIEDVGKIFEDFVTEYSVLQQKLSENLNGPATDISNEYFNKEYTASMNFVRTPGTINVEGIPYVDYLDIPLIKANITGSNMLKVDNLLNPTEVCYVQSAILDMGASATLKLNMEDNEEYYLKNLVLSFATNGINSMAAKMPISVDPNVSVDPNDPSVQESNMILEKLGLATKVDANVGSFFVIPDTVNNKKVMGKIVGSYKINILQDDAETLTTILSNQENLKTEAFINYVIDSLNEFKVNLSVYNLDDEKVFDLLDLDISNTDAENLEAIKQEVTFTLESLLTFGA